MTAVDLFCGGGGLSLGLTRAGVDVVLGVDRWDAALAVHRRNLGLPVLCHDLGGGPPRLPKVDCLAASPPCQDFSSAGRRAEDHRARLTVAFAELAVRVRPRWIVLENVPPAAGSRAYARARDLLRAVYGLTEVTLNAEYYGVPQRRRRFLVVGRLGGRDGELAEGLLAGRTDRPLTVREALGRSPAIAHYYWHPRYGKQRGVWSVDEPAPTITGRPCPRPPGYRCRPGDATSDLSGVSALTLREAARIQGFPPTWDWDAALLREAWKMVGNAVPVSLGEHVGRAIRRADGERPPPDRPDNPVDECDRPAEPASTEPAGPVDRRVLDRLAALWRDASPTDRLAFLDRPSVRAALARLGAAEGGA